MGLFVWGCWDERRREEMKKQAKSNPKRSKIGTKTDQKDSKSRLRRQIWSKMLSCIQSFEKIKNQERIPQTWWQKMALRGSISGPGEILKGIKNRPFEHRSAFGASKMQSRGGVWKKLKKMKKNRLGNESPWRWEQSSRSILVAI